MKINFKIATVIAMAVLIGFSMISCGFVGGKFTITGIPSSYNGKYAYLIGVKSDSSFMLNGALTKSTLPCITDGSVTLSMWKFVPTTIKTTMYTGNDTVEHITIGIFNSEKMEGAVGNPLSSMYFARAIYIKEFKTPITFKNGSATKAW